MGERNKKRLSGMLKVDTRRMFTSRLFYIMLAICLCMPILILVMTTMMDGSVTVDPQTGVETVVEGFDNAWQIIGTVGENDSGNMNMSMTSMLNINMLYFAVAVLVSIFVSEDFRSGYAKNIFTVRARKGDYVISKSVVCSFVGAFMLLAFFIGSVIGGSISGLPFDMVGFNALSLTMSIISKIMLVPIFVSFSLVMSVIGKHKLWLSMLLSLCCTMFLFNIAPMVSPLNSSIINVVMCGAGGLLFLIGMGIISKQILKKTSLV